MVLVVKNLPANAGDTRDAGSIPGLGRSSGGKPVTGLRRERLIFRHYKEVFIFLRTRLEETMNYYCEH